MGFEAWSIGHKRALLAELIGTAFLVVFIKVASSTVGESGFAPLAIGFGLMNLIWSFGHISGAVFNPCVALAIRIREPEGWEGNDNVIFMSYIMIELIGGIIGGWMAWMIGGGQAAAVYPQTNPDLEHSSLRAFAAEAVFTYLLCSVIIRVATDKRIEDNQFYGLAIGTTVTVGAFSVGSISGGCFNLAVYVGCVISALCARSDTMKTDGTTKEWWIYLIAPMLGAILAGLNFRFFYRDSESETSSNLHLQKVANDCSDCDRPVEGLLRTDVSRN